MKKIILFFIMSLFAFNLWAAEGTLKFGIAPSNPNSRESMQIFLGYLSEKTGAKFELIEADFEKILSMLVNGEIDFADLTSSVYATAINMYGDKLRYIATVAARNEKGDLVPYYKGVFFVLKSSPYKSLLDLKGKSFAFVSKTSTSGYVYPLATLSSQGIDPDKFFGTVAYTGEHAKIFEGLKTGFLDAGVSNYDAFEKAKAIYGDVFKSIAETAEIPSGAIVASASTVNSELAKKVETALVSVKPTDPVVNYPGFLYKGWVKKSGGFYEFLKKIMKHVAEIPFHPYR